MIHGVQNITSCYILYADRVYQLFSLQSPAIDDIIILLTMLGCRQVMSFSGEINGCINIRRTMISDQNCVCCLNVSEQDNYDKMNAKVQIWLENIGC